MTPPQERSGRRRVPHTPPGFPVDVGAACTLPGNVAATRNVAGHANLHGGVKTPPYGKREHGGSDRRSQQDKIARAACRPPLRPNGNSQFSIFVLNLRKVVGRGLDPAAGMSRQAQRFQQNVRFSCRRRGGVYAARERCGNPQHCGPREFARRGQNPALRDTGTRQQRPAFATR